ncbi:hypothetical protein D3C86_1581800 [compost metagenome]
MRVKCDLAVKEYRSCHLLLRLGDELAILAGPAAGPHCFSFFGYADIGNCVSADVESGGLQDQVLWIGIDVKQFPCFGIEFNQVALVAEVELYGDDLFPIGR